MDKAEERALECYPSLTSSFDRSKRLAYRNGYHQAEKDTLERAIAWLKSNAVNYIYNYTDTYPDAPFGAAIGGKCWEDLKEYMDKEDKK